MGSKWSNMQGCKRITPRGEGPLHPLGLGLADYGTKPDQRTTGTPLYLLKLRLLMLFPWRPWEASSLKSRP